MKFGGDQLLTSSEVGELLQVNPSSVKKWVDEGLLEAFRTPGGHRRVRAADLVTFLVQHRMPIPHVLQDAAKKRLLVVDADAEHLRSVSRSLKRFAERVDVMTATNAVDALVAVGSFQPQSILLDTQLPDLDPIETCRRLRRNRTAKDIAVYLLTGSPTPALEQRAAEAGAAGCLAKPLETRRMLTRIFPSRDRVDGDGRASW